MSGPWPLGVVKDKGHDLTRNEERVGGRFAERREHGAGIHSLLRPERWRAAVETLAELQEHYQAWIEDLPEGLQETPVAERLEAIAELDLETLRDIDPPSGYGRD